MPTRVISAAPGKLIIAGEHAVVYGKQALALAVDRFATTTISQNSAPKIHFEFLNDGLQHVTTLQELELLKTVISNRYQQFISGKCRIKEVIHSPLELIQYAVIYLVENLFLPIHDGLRIQLALNFPVGCGMGASAAVILSLIHALSQYYGQDLTADKYLHCGREIENLQHGRSSGLDLFLSLSGGCYFFADGQASKRNLPNFPLQIVNTGRPVTTTGECIEYAAKYLQQGSLIDDFSQVVRALDLAWQHDDLEQFRECIKINHRLLQEIGVVPKKVSNFIADIAARGNVAKISGAGSVVGDSAGIVLVFGSNKVEDLVAAYGYEILLVNGEADGVRIL